MTFKLYAHFLLFIAGTLAVSFLSAQTTYSGNSLFQGYISIKALGGNAPLGGYRNTMYLDAGNYSHNSSTLLFIKNQSVLGEMGTDMFANGGSDLYLGAGQMNSTITLNPFGSGNVSVGMPTAHEKLTVNGNIFMPLGNSIGFYPTNFSFQYHGNSLGHYSLGWYWDPNYVGAPVSYYSSYGGINFFTAQSSRMFISPTGAIGIGTLEVNQGGHKLYVEGGIRARKVTVDIATWADYVFEPGYKLLPLTSLKQFIEKNKHLPNVPTEKVAKKGLDVASTQTMLLRKIEELTLYMLQQQEEINKLKKRMDKIR